MNDKKNPNPIMAKLLNTSNDEGIKLLSIDKIKNTKIPRST